MCLCGGFCFVVLSCLAVVVSCCVVLCCVVQLGGVRCYMCCVVVLCGVLWYDTDITETYLFRISSDIIAMAAKFKDNKLHKKVKIVFKNLEVIRGFSLTFVFTSLRPSS